MARSNELVFYEEMVSIADPKKYDGFSLDLGLTGQMVTKLNLRSMWDLSRHYGIHVDLVQLIYIDGTLPEYRDDMEAAVAHAAFLIAQWVERFGNYE